jgi:hypothetical protein
MRIPGHCTPKEIMARFGWKRAQLNHTARREGWERYEVGNSFLYREQEIADYALMRNRTDLLRKAGWKLSPGLVRHEEWDYDPGCPECGLLAVYTPDQAGWVCMAGHNGSR